MKEDKVSEHFESEAFEYDGLIHRLIPKYQEQHEIIRRFIPFNPLDSITVLDLGCGTGVLAYLVLKTFPKAKVVAFDLAENMLQVCRTNLNTYKERLALRQGNFATDDIGRGYDVVVSGLATHHLNDTEKRRLYSRIFNSLNPGGIFINREIVLGGSPDLIEQYHSIWRQYIKSNAEDDEKWFNKYLEEDIPASVENQLNWLREVGYKDVGCHWQYINFAIFSGRKVETSDIQENGFEGFKTNSYKK